MNLTTQILSNPNEIIKYLQLGISIPIWPEFYEYIIHDIQYFDAKLILIKENGNATGNVLVYADDKEILYFGYFGVLNHNKRWITFLLSELMKYAENNNFKFIRGPINIPTVIFGWGFMEEGSLESLFAGKPVNPPIYYELFREKGFYIKFEEKSWEGNYLRINPYKLKKFDYTDYQYYNPKDINDWMNLKNEFIRIHNEFMPDYGKITPSVENLLDNYANYVFKYGYNFMIFFIKYKPNNKIVGCGSCLPNPFRKDKNGNYDSLIAYSWVVDPEHRGKGLTSLLYGATSLKAWKKKFRYTSGPSGGNENIRFAKFADIVNLQVKRTHFVLEFKL